MAGDGDRLPDFAATISELRHCPTFAAPDAVVVLECPSRVQTRPLTAVMLQRHGRQIRAKTSREQMQHPCSKTTYSITSSARASRVGGTVTPSALAVLRLMKYWNLVGCSTGSSLGLEPFSTFSTKTAAR